MPVGSVAPITGKLRRKFFFDISMALGGGTIFGLAFWYVQRKKTANHRYGVHVPRVQQRMLTCLICLPQVTRTTPSSRTTSNWIDSYMEYHHSAYRVLPALFLPAVLGLECHEVSCRLVVVHLPVLLENVEHGLADLFGHAARRTAVREKTHPER